MQDGRQPKQIKVAKNKKAIFVEYENETLEISGEMLRVYSPSAEVQGHRAEQKILVRNKENVEIENIIPTGNYAVRIIFNDGHQTGIYNWKFIYDMGKNHSKFVEEYKQKLLNDENNP